MDTEQLQQCHYSNVGMQADMVTLRDPDSIVLYDISAEASRLSLSVLGPTQPSLHYHLMRVDPDHLMLAYSSKKPQIYSCCPFYK